MKTQTAPLLLLSKGPPINAVLLSVAEFDPASGAGRATKSPKSAAPFSPVPFAPLQPLVQSPTSFVPCADHADPERVKTHAAPAPLSSPGAPRTAVLPSAVSATAKPSSPAPVSPVPPMPPQPTVQSPVNLPLWSDQDPADRVNTHAAPALLSSAAAPSKAVLPSAERATLDPS